MTPKVLPRAEIDMAGAHSAGAHVTVLSDDAMAVFLDNEAQRLVGRPAAEAFLMLDRGELAGSAAADALRNLRIFLLAD